MKIYDWMLTDEAAKILAANYLSVFADVPTKKGAVPLSQVKVVEQDDLWGGEQKARLIDKWLNEVFGQ